MNIAKSICVFSWCHVVNISKYQTRWQSQNHLLNSIKKYMIWGRKMIKSSDWSSWDLLRWKKDTINKIHFLIKWAIGEFAGRVEFSIACRRWSNWSLFESEKNYKYIDFNRFSLLFPLINLRFHLFVFRFSNSNVSSEVAISQNGEYHWIRW